MFWYIIHSILVALAVFFSGCLLGGLLRRFKALVFGVSENEHCCGDPYKTPAQKKAELAAAASAAGGAHMVSENDGDVTIVESDRDYVEPTSEPVVYETDETQHATQPREEDVVIHRSETHQEIDAQVHAPDDHIEVQDVHEAAGTNTGAVAAGVAGVAAGAATYLREDDGASVEEEPVQVDVQEEQVYVEPSVLPEIKRDHWVGERSEIGRVAVDDENPHHFRYAHQSGDGRISGDRTIQHNVWDDGETDIHVTQPLEVTSPSVSEVQADTDTQEAGAGTAALATAASVVAGAGVVETLRHDKIEPEKSVQLEDTSQEEDRQSISFTANGPCQDLSLIRGLEADDEEELNDLGICRYDQLSNLSAKEVHYLKMRTGCGHRIHSQGWIEQSFLLAKEENTLFSKKKR